MARLEHLRDHIGGAMYPLVFLAIVLLYKISRIGSRPGDLPPGPPTLPVLGNIHQMPSTDVHKRLQTWAQKYGPVYSLMLGTKTMIVLSSDEAVKELLDKRSSIYSDRPDMYIGGTLGSGGLRLVMMPYGKKWRDIRKIVHTILNINAAKTFEPYQTLENRQMLAEILERPTEFHTHIRRYANSLISAMTFGWRAPTLEDENIKTFWDTFEQFSAISQTGTSALVEYFPWLRKLPDSWMRVKAHAKALHKREKVVYKHFWVTAKEAVRNRSIQPCFCVTLAKEQEKLNFSDDDACYITGTLLEAGSDTTSSTLYGFIQAMVLFPEAQKKAQAEIDRVIGHERFPHMGDESDLPYIRGCVKESLRWMPATVLGVPHATTQDDTYLGYRIPKGATVVNNVYTLNYDLTRYPDPTTFDPDRYKNILQSASEAAKNPDVSQRDHFTFGAGRRFCSGTHIAERSLFLAIATILWAFDIVPVKDKNGQNSLPNPERLTQGIICQPEHYEVNIRPRSEAKAAMILQDWRKCEAEFLHPNTKQWKQVPTGVALPSV